MKRYEEIDTYSKSDDFSPHEWASDRNAQLLESEGYKVIPVDRSHVVIEQCEPDDDFPEGWCLEPIKLTVYPDLDLDPVPQKLYIHCGRYGIMNVLSERGGRLLKSYVFDAASVRRLSSAAQVKLWLDYIELGWPLSLGKYWVYSHSIPGRKEPKLDLQLKGSITRIKEELGNMLKRLEELPDYDEEWLVPPPRR